MFFHSFKYSLLTILRDKGLVFWCFLFPIVLSLLFNFAFSNLGASETFDTIPVALVTEDLPEEAEIPQTLKDLKEGDKNFLEVHECATMDEAEELLNAKEVAGIFTYDDALVLTVNSQMKSFLVQQSILSAFTDQYNLVYSTMLETMENDITKMPLLAEQLQKDTHYLTDKKFTEGDVSEKLTYFFNLIAMACMYAAFMGNQVSNYNQANLSAQAARRAVSPTRKWISALSGILAAVLLEFVAIMTAVGFIHFVLGISFGEEVLQVALLVFAGSALGVSLGYFVGSMGHATVDTKFGILVCVSMGLCFTSGLMFGAIQVLIDGVFPLFNKLNPAALISNSFYAMVVCPSPERYSTNLLTILAEALILTVLGVLKTRRSKYASL